MNRFLLPLISLSLAGCFAAVPEAECLRDLDCDAGRCIDNRCTSGMGGGSGGGSATGGGSVTGGGTGTGGGVATGGGAGGGMAVGGGMGTGGGMVTGGGAGGGTGVDGGPCNCTDLFGNCQPGNSPLACGRTGQCQSCGFGEQCVNNTCAQAPCGPQTCAGCCTNNFCVVGTQQNAFACGNNGAACNRCPQGQTCNNGACTTPPPCSAATCPTGCCQNNQCVTSGSRFACGVAGAACQRCPMGQDCNFGVCLPTTFFDAGTGFDAGFPQPDAGVRDAGTTVPAGSPCTTAQQCQPPQGAFCLQANIAGQNTGYTGGYCSANCGPNQPCAGGSVCVTESFFGASQSTCRASCTQVGQQSSCRQGYLCAPSPNSTTPGFCRPRCDAMGALTGCGPGQMCNATTGLCQ